MGMSEKVIQHSNDYRRARKEQGLNALEVFMKRLREDTAPSFDHALKSGRHDILFAKTAGVALGMACMVDGLRHIFAGYDEEVDDLFIRGATGRNHVRMFTGATELLLGLSALYLGATKGPRIG